MTNYRYVSADNHLDLIWCPPALWQDRLPSSLRDAGPQVVESGGQRRWTWEGKLWGPSNSGGGRGPDAFGESALNAVAGELAPGDLPPSDPELVLAHMDRAGIWANVIYGPTRKMRFESPRLAAAANTAWNDFMIDLSAADPDRIVALPNLPNAVAADCVAEARRMAAAGAKGVEFSVFTAQEPVWSPVWEPLWSVLEETGLVLSMHIGAPAGQPYPPREHGRYPAHFCFSPFATQAAMAEIVFSGVLERHPGLKVAFGECRVGWLPFFIEHMDRQARERPTDVPLSLKPSEYWQRQLAATFEDDVIGIKMLQDESSHLQYMVMWGSDYPHNPVTWPNTDSVLDQLFAGVPQDVKDSALFGRACDFYRLTLPAAVPEAG
jgi:predicted TIM-barrel fold metal-dependent hydrolase